MPSASSVSKMLAPLALATAGPAAVAQEMPAPAPEAWTVSVDERQPAVRIGKTAVDGSTQFIGSCSRHGGPRFAGVFIRYAGADLQHVDGAAERVLFEVRGDEWKDAFAVQLRYSARSRSWAIAGSLAPVFLDSFARGRSLVVLNSQRQPVFAFDLTGSGNAARTMRSTCGAQPVVSSTSSLAPR